MAWRNTFLTNGLIFAAGLLSGALAARWLGVQDRGLLAAVTYWPQFLTGMASLGLNTAVVIRIGQGSDERRLTVTLIALSLSLALPVALIGAIAMPWLIGGGREDYIPLSQYFFLAFVPASFLAMNLLALDQGRMIFTRFNYQRLIQALAYPLLLFAFWATGYLTVRTAAVAMLAGTVIVAFWRLLSVRGELNRLPSVAEAKGVLSIGARVHAVDMLVHLSVQVDRMVLVLAGNDRSLGLYVVALTVAGAAQGIFVQTYYQVILPVAARGISSAEVARSLRRLWSLLLMSALAIWLILPWVLPLVFSNDFTDAVPIARLLIVAALFAAMQKSLLYLLRARGQNRAAAKSAMVILVVLGLGALPALSIAGIWGLAWVVLCAQLIGLVWLWPKFSQSLGVRLRDLISMRLTQ